MRAITYSRTGGPEVLTLVDKPMPEPAAHEMRVRLHRSGVNPTDWKARQGSVPGVSVEPAQVPNQDGAGVVDAVGPGVDHGLLGHRVWVWEAARGRPEGTAQEYAVIPAHQAVPLPDGASFDLGASLGIPFLTAHRCLTVTEDGPSRLGPGTLEGRTVLVAGGAGAVGNAAIQLARWSDARVVSTVSGPEKGHLAARAGADLVVDYKTQDVVQQVRAFAPHGVHTVVEVAAVANASVDTEVLAPHGSVAVYAGTPGQTFSLPVRESMASNARWQFVLVYTAPHRWKMHAIEDVTAAVFEEAVRVGDQAGLPLHHYPLDETAAAHAAVENGAVGKVVVDVAD